MKILSKFKKIVGDTYLGDMSKFKKIVGETSFNFIKTP